MRDSSIDVGAAGVATGTLRWGGVEVGPETDSLWNRYGLVMDGQDVVDP